MAKDSLSIRLVGGASLDRKLSKMRQRVATRLVSQSLGKGAADLRKNVKKATPVASKDTTGFKRSSLNTTVGQLRRSVKSGLRKNVNVGRDTFLAAVTFAQGGGSSDGFYARWVVGRHAPNAFGYKGGNGFLNKAVNNSKSSVQRIIGEQLARKIVIQEQPFLNKPHRGI